MALYKLRRENCFDEGSRSKPHGGNAAAVGIGSRCESARFSGATALMWAVHRGEEAVGLLLKLGQM